MTVFNKHHGNVPANAIYIGRGSKWGNPFVIGKDGDRDEVVDKYETYLRRRIEDSDRHFLVELARLHGEDLVCFCAPKKCHGYVLEHYAALAAIKLDAETDDDNDRFDLG